MELGTFSVPFEVKFAGDGAPAGSFEGYGAVYNNIDRGGDLIEPGAFAKSLSTAEMQGIRIPMYFNHDHISGSIGVWDDISEDKNGLAVKGRLIGLDTDIGRMNYARMREGASNGLSIGYSVPPGGSRRGSGKGGEPVRYLKQVHLREISVVDDPMNPRAKANFIKSAEGTPFLEVKTLREFETALREVFGWSRAKSRAVAEQGFKQAQTEETREVVASIERLGKLFKDASTK